VASKAPAALKAEAKAEGNLVLVLVGVHSRVDRADRADRADKEWTAEMQEEAVQPVAANAVKAECNSLIPLAEF
jgi:hypothetical protein